MVEDIGWGRVQLPPNKIKKVRPAADLVQEGGDADLLDRQLARMHANNFLNWAQVPVPHPQPENLAGVPIEPGLLFNVFGGNEERPVPVVQFIPPTEKSTRVPRFKLKYETDEEFSLRLNNTIIFVYDKAYYVEKVHNPIRCHLTRQVGRGFAGRSSDGERIHVVFNDEGLNLRGPEPGYIDIPNTGVFNFVRVPSRIYKQGICGDNSSFVRVGTKQKAPVFGNIGWGRLLSAFENRPVIQWDPELMKDNSAVRLSDRIAVTRVGKTLYVEHRGFNLGPMMGDNKMQPKHNSIFTKRALEAVGLTFGEV